MMSKRTTFSVKPIKALIVMPDSETDLEIRNEINYILTHQEEYIDLCEATEDVLLSYGVDLDYLPYYLG